MQGFQFLILGYRDREELRAYRLAFNSSFQDTRPSACSPPSQPFPFNSSFQDTKVKKLERKGTELSIPHFRILQSFRLWVLMLWAFNSSFQDTGYAKTGTIWDTIFFQFLILGYHGVTHPRRPSHMCFQFLILGYATAMQAVIANKTLSIPHFRIPRSFRKSRHSKSASFNSSFQDTNIDPPFRKGIENFQFLILGYRIKEQGARIVGLSAFNSSFQDTWVDAEEGRYIGDVFQFLILGYTKKQSKASPNFFSFNSSFQDTGWSYVAHMLKHVNFQFLILGYPSLIYNHFRTY